MCTAHLLVVVRAPNINHHQRLRKHNIHTRVMRETDIHMRFATIRMPLTHILRDAHATQRILAHSDAGEGGHRGVHTERLFHALHTQKMACDVSTSDHGELGAAGETNTFDA